MRERIVSFLADMDGWLAARAAPGEGLDFYVIGKASVILFFGGDDFGASTSDVDVVLIGGAPEGLLLEALHLFGKNSPGAILPTVFIWRLWPAVCRRCHKDSSRGANRFMGIGEC